MNAPDNTKQIVLGRLAGNYNYDNLVPIGNHAFYNNYKPYHFGDGGAIYVRKDKIEGEGAAKNLPNIAIGYDYGYNYNNGIYANQEKNKEEVKNNQNKNNNVFVYPFGLYDIYDFGQNHENNQIEGQSKNE